MNHTDRTQKVFDQVSKLYENSEREMGRWMWDNHVQWVAEKSAELAKKYNANIEKCYVSALLHDLGDVWMEREEEDFDPKSNREGRSVLEKAGFTKDEKKEILEVIVEPHSCYPNNLPTTVEGKVLATADGMYHLVSNFFVDFCWNHTSKDNLQEYLEWVREKLERDLNVKIFFEDEKQEVIPRYEALKEVFVNKSYSN